MADRLAVFNRVSGSAVLECGAGDNPLALLYWSLFLSASSGGVAGGHQFISRLKG